MTEWWSGDNIGNLRKGFVMRIGKIGVVIIGLVPFNVYAECTPAPDCASIGYTETSCEGDSLKCPFDITKMMCMPCDSSFKYACSGDNITGGTGSACNGKYVSCECSEGSVFKDGACACDDSCTVGAIYYSDGTCSSCVDSNKTAIGVVVKDNELIVSRAKGSTMSWAANYIDTSLTNYANGTAANSDLNGKANTSVIIATYTSGTADNNAAVYCNSYYTEGTNSGDWYLPSGGELTKYVNSNYSKVKTTTNRLGWGNFAYYLWTSTEGSNDTAFGMHTDGGGIYRANKTYATHVACFLNLTAQ